MADNYVEYHQQEFEARKAKKERERKKRLRRYLEAYKKKLDQEKAQQAAAPHDTPPNS